MLIYIQCMLMYIIRPRKYRYKVTIRDLPGKIDFKYGIIHPMDKVTSLEEVK